MEMKERMDGDGDGESQDGVDADRGAWSVERAEWVIWWPKWSSTAEQLRWPIERGLGRRADPS